MVSQIALHPFCYTYISLHIRQLLSHFSLNITLCIILCILLSVFYVLIHALCVSVHFRAISKCYHKYQKLIKGVLEDILLSLKADGDRDRGSVYRGFVEEPYHRLLPCSLYIELFHVSISIYTESTSSSLW